MDAEPAGNGTVIASSRSLSLEAMDEMIDAYKANPRTPVSGRWERRFLWVGIAGATVGLVFGNMLGGRAGLVIAAVGLLIEVVGLGASLALMLRREWPSLRRPKRELARDLDHDFAQWSRYVTELQGFPVSERDPLLRYIQARRRTMTHRTGVFLGGIERLGVLPILFALYLQFKDWEWGDWSMLAEVKLVQGLMILALLLAYLLGWYFVGLNARVEAYEQVLAEARERDQGK